jgi:hypothetical protein
MPVQDYTAMTRFFVTLVVLLTVTAIALVVSTIFLRTSKRVHAVTRMARRQDSAISDTIIEITSGANLYAGFPQPLLERMLRLHSEYPSVISGKDQDEIED